MFEQLARLQKRFAAIPKEVREAVQPVLMNQATELAGTMERLAPEDTGALVDSIAVTPAGQATPAYSQPGGSMIVPENAVAVTVGNSAVRYAHLVEFGTANAPAQSFFWPAYRLLVTSMKRGTRTAIRRAIRKYRGK